MKASVIKKRIKESCPNANVIVLKGFTIIDILKLAKDYFLIDNYILEGNKIDLSKIQTLQLLQELMKPAEGVCIMTYESFLDLTLMIRDLTAFGKTFCILKNNLLQRYENPTTNSIPDFDSLDFQNDFSVNENYSKYYSFCMHVNKREFIQYIEYYIDNADKIKEVDLIQEKELKLIDSLNKGTYATLSEGNDTLSNLLEDIYFNRPIVSDCFLIDTQEKEKEIFKILQGASSALHLGLKFYRS